jgi:hypothetical protein
VGSTMVPFAVGGVSTAFIMVCSLCKLLLKATRDVPGRDLPRGRFPPKNRTCASQRIRLNFRDR